MYTQNDAKRQRALKILAQIELNVSENLL